VLNYNCLGFIAPIKRGYLHVYTEYMVLVFFEFYNLFGQFKHICDKKPQIKLKPQNSMHPEEYFFKSIRDKN
jgi:hypothetical protein